MRDLAKNWPALPDWETHIHEDGGIRVTTVGGLAQHLVSGHLHAFGEGTGALGLARHPTAVLRMARDRLLVVDGDPAALRNGWHPEGFAVTDVSSVYHVFEIAGPGIAALLREALAIDPVIGSPSAAVVFAGIQAVLYRYNDDTVLRLHVERGHAAYILDWLRARQDDGRIRDRLE